MTNMTFRRTAEIAANIAIVVVAIVIVVSLSLGKVRPKASLEAPAVGSQIALPDIDWHRNGRTLLMVLQKGCHYCEESAGFYHRLYELRAESFQPRIVAVIPGDRAKTLPYLSDHGLLADDVIDVSLDKISDSGTPTFLLVDDAGTVKNVWVGKLNDAQETAVILQSLGIQ